MKNRHRQFVIDGEAVLLGADGVFDFNGLHSGEHNDQVQLYALEGEDLRALPLSMRSCSRVDGTASSFRAGRDRSRPVSGRVQHGARGHCVETGGSPLSGRTVERLGGQGQEPKASRLPASAGSEEECVFEIKSANDRD